MVRDAPKGDHSRISSESNSAVSFDLRSLRRPYAGRRKMTSASQSGTFRIGPFSRRRLWIKRLPPCLTPGRQLPGSLTHRAENRRRLHVRHRGCQRITGFEKHVK